MKVSVFGLGYVGSVSAASFAADGHTVVGVDVNPDKVASLNEGRSPIVEKGLDELIRDNAANGRLRATTSTKEAVDATELSLICVGTPSRRNGSLDLSYLERVCEQIGEADVLVFSHEREVNDKARDWTHVKVFERTMALMVGRSS